MPLSQPFQNALEHGQHHRRFKGSFAPSGAGISTAAGAVRGTGFTASYNGATGQYRVQLEIPFKQLVAGKLTYQGLTADTTISELVLGDVNGAAVGGGTIDINAFTSGSKANITASGVARRINFEFVVAVNDSIGTGATA
jgi:hypothetical protein